MTVGQGWRLPLRLARREAGRHRGRSLLVVMMIALPVLGVTAADVLLRTSDVDSAESLDRRLGAAEARVTADAAGAVLQAPDPDVYLTWTGAQLDQPVTATELSSLLGGARLVPQRTGTAVVRTAKGTVTAEVLEVDLADPVTAGVARLSTGRLPGADGEVVVNAALAAKGYGVGDTLDLSTSEEADPVVVGIAEAAVARRSPVAMGPVGSLLTLSDAGPQTWLVAGDPVSWTQVRELNALGASVLSRAVVLDPPPLPPQIAQMMGQPRSAALAVVLLIVAMALIEVVLLAGPAFAVGARQQSRNLALLVAAGGTPRQSRRVVLAGAVVLGGVASLAGVALGIVVARALLPVVQRYSDTWFGPFEVPWWHLLGIAAFGLVSALGAALVPAWIASRQDVVAVLAGRRGDGKASLRSPILGLVLLGAGIAGSAYGVTRSGSGELAIAASAIVSVLGMILLVPVVLTALARLSTGLPLVLRYAMRDAVRHRTRTVPAVAAVAATVAGVVALGIGTQSDAAQARAEYVPTLSEGVGSLQWYDDRADWTAARRLLERELPGAEVTTVSGVRAGMPGSVGYTDLRIRPTEGAQLLDSWGSPLGSDLLVASSLPVGLREVPDEQRAEAQRTLAAGGMVAFSNLDVSGAQELRLRVRPYDADGSPGGPTMRSRVDALVVPTAYRYSGPQAVISPELAASLDLRVAPVSLSVDGRAITEAEEENVVEALGGLTENGSFTVERGYPTDDAMVVVQLVLAGLGAVLMLGGTLTATFLALSDARPDLATLSAVGAAPRTRRGVAAAYATVVGVVGALLGAAVGFIPGIAVTYPLTVTPAGTAIGYGSGSITASDIATGPYLDIPWLLILGLVVALPLLTAAVVGLSTRSRLPLVARLD